MWINSVKCISVTVALGLGQPAVAEQPLSAIDWLSQSVATPVAMPQPLGRDEAPTVTKGAMPEDVSVSTIGAPSRDAVGLLPGSATGLPRAIWGGTPTARIAALLLDDGSQPLPALQGLLYTLLLAEVEPPADSDGNGTLLLARVDRLLDLGALDQASALLDEAGADDPESFRRWFDVALLLGEEDSACFTMRALPNVAPTFSARIFCLAQGEDWTAAALTLQTAQALGFVTPEESAMLARFLDPELFEDEPPLPQPARVTPLVWRMMEAVGQPLATARLPLAFANGDLRSNIGWKAQIEAGERLARSGALAANRLLGLYDARRPPASGGVWDRVAAVQAFDKAFAAQDAARVAATLPAAFEQMTAGELEVVFADIYGQGLGKLALTGSAGALAFRIGLLSPFYEAVAQSHTPGNSTEAFLAGVARGDLTGTIPPDGLGAAVRDGFTATSLPDDLAALTRDGRLGEAILLARTLIQNGAEGEIGDVSTGLAVLRQVGLEDVARRTALELMLLERRG